MTEVQKLVKNVDRGILDAEEALAKPYLSPAERRELAALLAEQLAMDEFNGRDAK